jgi:hypothetical protein
MGKEVAHDFPNQNFFATNITNIQVDSRGIEFDKRIHEYRPDPVDKYTKVVSDEIVNYFPDYQIELLKDSVAILSQECSAYFTPETLAKLNSSDATPEQKCAIVAGTEMNGLSGAFKVLKDILNGYNFIGLDEAIESKKTTLKPHTNFGGIVTVINNS